MAHNEESVPTCSRCSARIYARFAPSAAQLAAVDASLRAHGLDPGAVSANGLAIPVTAPAGAVESAFSLSFAYTADELASAYGFSSLYAAGDKGASDGGQKPLTVALFELEPYFASDIQAYQTCYGTST